MKKILLGLIACASISLIGMDTQKTLCALNTIDDSDTCCRDLPPYTNQPFYQPHLEASELSTAVYPPQMNSAAFNEPNARLIRPERSRRHSYNPAVDFFHDLRAWLSDRSRVASAQDTELSSRNVEQEHTDIRSCNIIGSLLSLTRCCRSTPE